jgi:hypothetical protein
MTQSGLLEHIFERLCNADSTEEIFSADEATHWPEGALETLVTCGLLGASPEVACVTSFTHVSPFTAWGQPSVVVASRAHARPQRKKILPAMVARRRKFTSNLPPHRRSFTQKFIGLCFNKLVRKQLEAAGIVSAAPGEPAPPARISAGSQEGKEPGGT